MSFLPTCAFNGRQSHFKSYITFTRIISAFNGRHPYFKSYLPFFQEIVSAFNANGRQYLYANFPVEYFLFVILISDILYIDDSICIVTPPFKYSVLRLESLI